MPSKKRRFVQGKHIAGKKISKSAMSEFGKAKLDYIFCPHGEAVYYLKSWHHASDFFTHAPSSKKDKHISFHLCPAHEMQKNKQYEGRIIIQDVPGAIKRDLTRLIEHMGEQSMRIDTLDRVLDMKWQGNQLIVDTSENQLAQKIGRKIMETFKKRIAKRIMRPKGGESDAILVEMAFTKKQK